MKKHLQVMQANTSTNIMKELDSLASALKNLSSASDSDNDSDSELTHELYFSDLSTSKKQQLSDLFQIPIEELKESLIEPVGKLIILA